MNNVIDEIRKKQDEIILMINSTFDQIVKEVSKIDNNNISEESEYEVIYPVTNTSSFKGKKVIAVILNDERVITPTWKNAVKFILEDAMKDKNMKNKLYDLRDKLLGRKRTRLSSNVNDMRSPVKLDEDLYIETHYDTETLMNFLLQILNEISYDYSTIKIAIKN